MSRSVKNKQNRLLMPILIFGVFGILNTEMGVGIAYLVLIQGS